MAKKFEVKKTWTKEDPLGMANIAETTATKMANNPNFDTPKISLTAMNTAARLVRTTYPTRLGDADERLAATNAVDDLNSKLTDQAGYVTEETNGDATKIASSGFTSSSDKKTKSQITDPVESVKLTPSSGGKLKMLAKKPLGCDKILFVIFTGPVVKLTLRGNILIIPDNASGINIVPFGKNSVKVEGYSDFNDVSVVAYSMNTAGISAASGVFKTRIL